MKALFYSFIALLLCVFVSCDKHAGNIERMANDFVTAVNAGDTAAASKIFPSAFLYKHAKIQLPIDNDIDVEYNEADSNYHVNFTDGRYIIVKVTGEESYDFADSHLFLRLDNDCYELAKKTNVPVRSISDLTLAKLFNEEEGSYINWLKNEYRLAASGNLKKVSFYVNPGENRSGGVDIDLYLKNCGKEQLEGSEYSVQFICSQKYGRDKDVEIIETVPGETINAGEEKLFYIGKPRSHNFFKWVIMRNFNARAQVVINGSLAKTLNKHADLKGDEYSRFMAGDSESDKYDIACKRKLTEEDLEGMTKEELRIMRNWIFARHGYIFKTADMKKFFSEQSWYEGNEDNVTYLLSDIELYNVDFIKSHE